MFFISRGQYVITTWGTPGEHVSRVMLNLVHHQFREGGQNNIFSCNCHQEGNYWGYKTCREGVDR